MHYSGATYSCVAVQEEAPAPAADAEAIKLQSVFDLNAAVPQPVDVLYTGITKHLEKCHLQNQSRRWSQCLCQSRAWSAS